MEVYKGKTIITTQPENQGKKLKEILSDSGINVHVLPMIRIELQDVTEDFANVFNTLSQFNLIVFTSKNGVKGFFENINSLNNSYDLPNSIEIAVIGKSTEKELIKYEQNAKYVNSGVTSDEFIKFLNKNVIDINSKVLLVLGNLAPNKIQSELEKRCEVQRIDVYNTLKPELVDKEILDYVSDGKVDLIVFTSPSACENYLEISNGIINTEIACIGKTTDSYLQSRGFKSDLIASNPQIELFANELKKYLNNNN